MGVCLCDEKLDIFSLDLYVVLGCFIYFYSELYY